MPATTSYSFKRLMPTLNMVVASAMLLLVVGSCAHAPAGADKNEKAAVSADTPSPGPDAALQQLLDGNARFVSGKLEHPDRSTERVAALAAGQHPIAVVLGCSDSRVPPEIVFDAGLGELFVVRVAGNTADAAGVGSIEYAVEHLGAPLIVVLGHGKCGAVKAAVDTVETRVEPAGHLGAVVDPIKPAVEKVLDRGGDVLDNAVHENVSEVVEHLKTSEPVLANEVHEGHVKIVGAYYDLSTGKVTVQK